MSTLDQAMNYLADMMTDTGWIKVTENYNVYYRKKNGFVTVRGSAAGVSVSQSGTLVGILPEGFRPIGYDCDNACSALGGSSELLVRVQSTSGKVFIFSNPASQYWSFCITFPVDS